MDEKQLIVFARMMGKQEGEAIGRYHGYLRGLAPDMVGKYKWADFNTLDAAYQEGRSQAYTEAYENGLKEGAMDAELVKGGS